jgi:hypothetical protein
MRQNVKIASVIGVMVVGGAALLGAGRAESAGQRCSEHTLRGAYVFAATGHNIVGGVPVPKAIVEQIEFDGRGTLLVPGVTVSVSGVILQPPPGDGSYTLEDDCSGTVDFTGGPSFAIYLSPNGDTGWMIQTNPNTVFQGTVTRVSR